MQIKPFTLLFLIIYICLSFIVPSAFAQGNIVKNGPDTTGRLMIKLPLSGQLSSLGQEAQRGSELALKTFGAGLNFNIIDEYDPEAVEPNLGDVSLVIGYLGEANFRRDAQKYILAGQPVIMPFFMTAEAAKLGDGIFFRMMPSLSEQGHFMAMEILKSKKRPNCILVITSPNPTTPQSSFVNSFTTTLHSPPQQEKPKGKAAYSLKPLDKSSLLISASLNDVMSDAFEADGLKNKKPDIIILSVNYHEALTIAPYLAASSYSKSKIWGPSSIALRDVGAAFTSLNLKLSLSLPINLDDASNKAIGEFTKSYMETWNVQPSWLAALAYDATALAVKAVSSCDSDEKVIKFFSGQSHHCLGTYTLSPGEGGVLPVTFMEVKTENLSHLP